MLALLQQWAYDHILRAIHLVLSPNNRYAYCEHLWEGVKQARCCLSSNGSYLHSCSGAQPRQHQVGEEEVGTSFRLTPSCYAILNPTD